MELKPIPDSQQEFLVGDPPYTRYQLADAHSDKSWGEFIERALRNGAVDAYCSFCCRISVFRVDVGYSRQEKINELKQKTSFIVEAQCSRDHREGLYAGWKCEGRIFALFVRTGDEVIKAGMFPSKADLDFGALDPVFSQELNSEHRAALGSAIGLRAHGIGAGSFVYLRRIFEALLEEAHSSARENPAWDESEYLMCRVVERIHLLRDHLPPRLVGTAGLYSILSTGVHDLSEAECLEHFDLVFKAIETILRQRHDEAAYKLVVTDLQRAQSVLSRRESTPDGHPKKEDT